MPVQESKPSFERVIANCLRYGRINCIAIVGTVVEQQTIEKIRDAESIGIDQDRRRTSEGGLGAQVRYRPPEGRTASGGCVFERLAEKSELQHRHCRRIDDPSPVS